MSSTQTSQIEARGSTDGAANAARRPRPSWAQRLQNNWPVVPMRLFLGALFLFAAYAKFNYPGFFGSTSPVGLQRLIEGARPGSPISSLIKPVSEHASVYGHIAAGAEIAIGAGLVFGFFARIAALGGILYTTIIVLSVHWESVREYTGSSGWFTSVDIAVAVALTVFVLGGAGPLSFDRLFAYLRARRDAKDDAEPSFYDSDTEDSRRRLQTQDDHATTYLPAAGYPAAGAGYAGQGGLGGPGGPGTEAAGPVAPTYPPAEPRYPVHAPSDGDRQHTEQLPALSKQTSAEPTASAEPTVRTERTPSAPAEPEVSGRSEPEARAERSPAEATQVIDSRATASPDAGVIRSAPDAGASRSASAVPETPASEQTQRYPNAAEFNDDDLAHHDGIEADPRPRGHVPTEPPADE